MHRHFKQLTNPGSGEMCCSGDFIAVKRLLNSSERKLGAFDAPHLVTRPYFTRSSAHSLLALSTTTVDFHNMHSRDIFVFLNSLGFTQGAILLLLILAPPGTATVSRTLYTIGTVLNLYSFPLTCI
jgi:hypothetical protein